MDEPGITYLGVWEQANQTGLTTAGSENYLVTISLNDCKFIFAIILVVCSVMKEQSWNTQSNSQQKSVEPQHHFIPSKVRSLFCKFVLRHALVSTHRVFLLLPISCSPCPKIHGDRTNTALMTKIKQRRGLLHLKILIFFAYGYLCKVSLQAYNEHI